MAKVFSAKYLDEVVEYYVPVYVTAETKEEAVEKFKSYSVEDYFLFEPSIGQIAEDEDELDEDELDLMDDDGFMEFDSDCIGG